MEQVAGLIKKENIGYKIREIVIIENEDDCRSTIERLNRECNDSFPVLGMDCEWVPETSLGVKNPVALLQLATLNGFCALFRLSHMSCLPDSLKTILVDEKILKVGVAIHNDVYRLRSVVRSWVDIRHLEFLLRTYPDKKSAEDTSKGSKITLGLASLSKRVLGITLNKNDDVRLGKWDLDQLSDNQIQYAAWDAFAAVLICYELIHQEEAIQAYSMKSPIDFLRNAKEVRYKQGEKSRTVGRQLQNRVWKWKNHAFLPSRRTPMYDNIFLLAPDGEILCTCDRKRAMWYVEKGIGEMIEEKICEEDDDGFTSNTKTCLKVQLKFEPSRRAIDESEKYYCLVKDNQCVVCGKEESFLRKHIVPHEYRKYFPVWMKSHQSHDVLLLCINCHIQSNCIDLNLRQKLSKDCDAPLTVAKSIEVLDAQVVKKVQSAAKALSRPLTNIPVKRRMELEAIVLNYFSIKNAENYLSERAITSEMLNDAMGLMTRVNNEAYIPHGLKVVKHFQETRGEEDGIRDLEVMWRLHFVDKMKPKHLPSLWSIHHFRMSPSEKGKGKTQSEDLEVPSQAWT